MAPNCHHHHLRYNLNPHIAQLSSCSDSNVQQNQACPKDLAVVGLITMALIATRDFHKVQQKGLEKSSIPELMSWKLKLTREREICLRISSEKECLRLVCKAVEAVIKHLL